MVGLVLVSQSRKVAESVYHLAMTASTDPLPVDYAGGAGGGAFDDAPGCDATDIMEAIMRVNSGDGVLVLMDHGEAIVAARLAEQLLGSDVPRIRLCAAPFVESAMAAAQKIATGADIDTVHEEAHNALAAKFHEMEDELGFNAGDSVAQPLQRAVDDVPEEALRIRFRSDDPAGLHLRTAALLHRALADRNVEARIRNYDSQGPYVNLSSIAQAVLADVRGGHTAEIVVWGADAEDAVHALRALIRDVLGGSEVDTQAEDTVSVAAVAAKAAGADIPRALVQMAPGIAVGTLYIHETRTEQLPPLPVADTEYEINRLDAAIGRVREDLETQRQAMLRDRPGEADVLEAQLLILRDPGLVSRVHEDIRMHSQDAASCYQARMLELADSYRRLDNPLLRERAADVSGICEMVLDALAGKTAADLSAFSDIVLYADEATPALIGRWAPGQLQGILTRAGSPSSHAAILAKSLGIPALGGYTPPPEATTGLPVAMDANRCEVAVQPDNAEYTDYENRWREWRGEIEQDAAAARLPSVSADGVEIGVMGNAGDIASVRNAMERGAEGIGLLRTESLFLNRVRAPEEDEQAERFGEIFRLCAERPLLLRTVDEVGEKILSRQGTGGTERSGLRGVRVYEAHPDLFKTHLRAILRGGANCDVNIMAPLISTVGEVDFCKRLLDECHEELAAAGVPHKWPVGFGIMVETPAAVLQAEELAGRVDFFAIGTNDLTHYVMCGERDVQEFPELSDGLHPAVLRAIAAVVAAGGRAGIPVSVCGEMAGDPQAARILIGLGVRHLSVNPGCGGKIKRVVRECDTTALAATAQQALRLDSAAAVRQLLERK